MWKLGSTEVEECLWLLCNRVWKGEGGSEGWREGVEVPVLKKVAGEKAEG